MHKMICNLVMWVVVTCGMLGATAGSAQSWLLVEAREVPNTCDHPMECLAQSRVAARNLLALTPDGRTQFVQSLNTAATIRGIPDEEMVTVSTIQPEDLHALPIAEKLVPLINHPGVYFDSTALDENENTVGFSDQVRAALTSLGVKFLTEEELELTPGRPVLSVSYIPRTESAGCIIPFGVSMSIKEEIVQTRNPGIKMTTSVWSGAVKENLANLNYTPMDALSETLQKFVDDYQLANPPA